MDDIYAALIGEGAGDGERARLISAALRRRKDMGMLGQITGDRTLSAAGKDLSATSDEYAEALQQIRQDNSRQGQTKQYQTGQLKHMDDVLAETIRNNDLDHEAQMAMARASQTRADRPTGPGKIPKLRQGDIKELQDLSQSIGIVQGLEEFMDKGGKFGAAKIFDKADGSGGIPIPGLRAFSNYAASKGFGDDDDKATYLAKQNWDRLYNIVERNAKFGATLTTEEKKSWADANPSVGQTDEQIRKALPIMRKVFEHRMQKKSGGLIKEGYNAEALADYTDVPGINLPGSLEDGTEVGAAPTAGAPAGAPKRVRVDAQGNIIP